MPVQHCVQLYQKRPGAAALSYDHIDRIISGPILRGLHSPAEIATPTQSGLALLPASDDTGANSFQGTNGVLGMEKSAWKVRWNERKWFGV